MQPESNQTPGWRIAAYVTTAALLLGAAAPGVAESASNSGHSAAASHSTSQIAAEVELAGQAALPVALGAHTFDDHAFDFEEGGHDHDHDHAHDDVPFPTGDNPNPNGIATPKPGFVAPYHSYDNLVRGFDAAGCTHQGVDIGGVGPYWGIGTPIYSMVKSKVIFVGTPESNPSRFGRRHTRGSTIRGGKRIPRRMEVEGYGAVFPFVRSVGSARTGVFVITKAIGTEIDGAYVRYMHMADVHPDVKVGDILEAGDEIGLLGATGTRSGMPHLHLDIEWGNGVRINPAPLIGIQNLLPSRCRPRAKRSWMKKRRQAARQRARANRT